MSDLLQDLTAAPALARGDLLFLVIDPSVTPLDRKAAIEFLLANLPKLDDVVLQSEVDSTTFFQILDTDGGVPVLNVDTVNERVGVGIAAPAQALDVLGIVRASQNIVSGQGISRDGDADTNIAFENDLIRIKAGNNEYILMDVSRLRFNNTEKDIDFEVFWDVGGGVPAFFIQGSSGDIGIGTTAMPSAGGGKVLTFGDNAADPTMASNTAGFYGKDVAGTVEAFAIDEAGNAAQLTSHPDDAPSAFYRGVSEDELPSFIRKSLNFYIGKIEWFRSDLPLRSYETFAAYNARHGFVAGGPGFLFQYDWTEQQQIQVERSEAEHAAWAAGDQTEPEPEIYTAEEPPQSLQDRGITLRRGS